MPRLETKRPRRVTGSYGPMAEALWWGPPLRGWQRYALGRILEHDKDGELVWPVAVLTVGRGPGKSYLSQVLAWWRVHQDVWDEDQPVAVMGARMRSTVRAVLQPMMRHVQDQGGRTLWGDGKEALSAGRGEIFMVASKVNAVTGLTLATAIVDEAWAVPADVVNAGVLDALRGRRSPQLLITSTAGDSRSDLLQTYRQQALEDGPAGDTLLLEWSVPAEHVDVYDERVWAWANPHIADDKRTVMAGLRRAARHQPESVFRQQKLNQWQRNVDGWVTRTEWARCLDRSAEPAGGVVLVDYTRRVDGWCAVHVGEAGDGVWAVRHRMSGDLADVWQWVRRRPGDPQLHVGAKDMYHRTPEDLHVAHLFGSHQTRDGIDPTLVAIRERRLLHDGSEVLTEHVLGAQILVTNVGGKVFRASMAHADDLNRLMVAGFGLVSARPVLALLV